MASASSIYSLSNNFVIYYQNVRGLRTKTDELLPNVLKQDADVIILTESNLNDSVYDHELFDKRYTVFRRDRFSSSSIKHDGGGVVIAVLQKHRPSRKFRWESKDEDLWIDIKYVESNTSRHLCICGVYNPSPATVDRLERITISLADVIQHKLPDNSDILLAGDFNLKKLDWQSVDATGVNPTLVCVPSSNLEDLLVDFLSFNSLHQINPIRNATGRTLDLVITSIPSSFSTVECQYPLVHLDAQYHPALIINMIQRPRKIVKIKRLTSFNFSKANYPKIHEDLNSINWNDHMRSNHTVDELIETFYDLIFSVIAKHTPVTIKNSSDFPCWYSRSLIRTLREKDHYHKRFKKYGNPRDYLTFKLLRGRCDKLIDVCLLKFRSDAPEHIRKNPKYFWNFVNSLRSNSNDIPDEMFLNDTIVTGGQNISELFCNHFQSNFSHNNNHSTSDSLSNHDISFPTLNSCYLSKRNILKTLKLLDINKGPGPDNLPPIFLRSCAKHLVEPLYIIFNKSLNSGFFPTRWKTAHITPIHKSGDRGDISNYRPISILSSVGKMFEAMVHKHLYFHLKYFFDFQQHGFLPGRSTASNLFGYVNDVVQGIERRNEVHAIYTDFSKAFDVVDRNLLVQKLGHAGICGSLLRWCESYLQNRSQLVIVRGFKSCCQAIPSGVPQGSHLGPLFFLVFINDLGSTIASKYKLYADDLKIYREINTTNDIDALQRDLDSVDIWCHKNSMVLNSTKCHFINFTRKKNPHRVAYKINGIVIKEVMSIRDLGVIVDRKMDFREHYEHIIKKAGKLGGFVIRQTKAFKQPEIPIMLFNCYVRSLLEYCSPVWNPYYDVHSKRIEALQSRFLYHLTYAKNKCRTLTSYDSRLKHFKAFNLSTRREVADIVFIFKIINGFIDSPDLLDKFKISVPLRGNRPLNKNTFALSNCRTNYGRNAPVNRLCRAYNKYCQDLDIFSTSVTCIKKQFLVNLKS